MYVYNAQSVALLNAACAYNNVCHLRIYVSVHMTHKYQQHKKQAATAAVAYWKKKTEDKAKFRVKYINRSEINIIEIHEEEKEHIFTTSQKKNK